MCTSCNGYEPESVTLQTAIIMVVKDLVQNDKSFSIHDITIKIREWCNRGSLEISEIENPDPDASFRFNVEHSDVRPLFNEMWDRGVFSGQLPVLNRRHNGRYWEFASLSDNDDLLKDLLSDLDMSDNDLLTPIVKKSQSTYSPTPNSMALDEKETEAKRRIKIYLENCARLPVFPTLKQVQSAIHRSRGLPLNFTCDEIGSLIADLGLTDKVSPSK